MYCFSGSDQDPENVTKTPFHLETLDSVTLKMKKLIYQNVLELRNDSGQKKTGKNAHSNYNWGLIRDIIQVRI